MNLNVIDGESKQVAGSYSRSHTKVTPKQEPKVKLYSLSLLITICLCSGCTAKQGSDLENDTSNAMHTLNEDAQGAGKSINTSVNNFKKVKHDDAQRNPAPESEFEKNTSKMMTKIGNEADDASEAVAKNIQDLGKNSSKSKNDPTHNKGDDSLGSSMDKSARAAGAQLQESTTSAERQASQQITRRSSATNDKQSSSQTTEAQK